MSVTSLVTGMLRGSTDEKKLEVNQKGELLTAQGLLPYAEMTRKYEGWSAISTAGAVSLVARPTTLANVTLWNGEPDGGKSYVIDRLFSHLLVSGAEDGRASLWACVHPIGTATPDTGVLAAAVNQKNGNRGGLYNGLSVFDIGDTCIDQGWYPWGTSVSYELTGVLPGAALEARVEGRIIIPPSAGISIQVVASVNDNTCCCGLSWYEVPLVY